MWQVQDSNLWPLGHEPSELPTAPTCDVCSLSSQTSCMFKLNKIWIQWIICWRLGLNEEPLAMIRSVSFCYRRASVTLLTSWLYFMNEQFSLHLYLPDCNVFGSACTDNSSFRCSPSAYLMQISWIFVCRASFRQVTASIDALQLLLFHAYYFCASICQRTIFHVRSMKLSSDARLSLPERPTL